MNRDNAKDYLPLIQALAEGKTIEKYYNGTWWRTQPDIEFNCKPSEYRIKPDPHPHQAMMDEAEADSSINWLEQDEYGYWFKVTTPLFRPDKQYRKEKTTVDMWLWAIQNHQGVVATSVFFPDRASVQASTNYKVLCKIEGSKITVEVEA